MNGSGEYSVPTALTAWPLSADELYNKCYNYNMMSNFNFKDEIYTLRKLLTNLEIYDKSLANKLSNCPFFHSDSAMSQTCHLISSLVTLGHFFFILLGNIELKYVYGIYTVLWFFVISIRDGILFFSSYLIPIALIPSQNGYNLCKMSALSIDYLQLLQNFVLTLAIIQLYYCSYKRFNSNIINGFVVRPIAITSPAKNQMNILQQSFVKENRGNRRTPQVDQKIPPYNVYTGIGENVTLQMVAESQRYGDKNDFVFFASWIITLSFLLVIPGLLILTMNCLWSVHGHFLSGYFSCNDFGICLKAQIIMMHVPVFLLFICNFILIFLTKRAPIFLFGHDYRPIPQNRARMWMLSKILFCQFISWCVTIWGSFLYHISLSHFHNLLNTLASIFLLINLIFSRPVLEVFFRISHPLTILKISNLAFPLPMSDFKRTSKSALNNRKDLN